MKRLMAEGYKQTEVGVIPEDWEVFDITSIVEKFIDYRGRTPKKLGMNWGGDILALSANNVQMGRIDRTKEAYYGSGELYARWMTNGDCEYGDILMTMEAPLGNIAQINTNDKYILSQRVILIRPVKTVEKNYLAWFMKFDYFQNQLNINSSGSTAKGIQRSKLSKIKIYLPRIQDEQKAIATALSDVDNLISSLEQLIEKKKAIKQGTMQELLTGRRRLKGFGEGKGYKQTELGMIPEDWEVKRLHELGEFQSGIGFPLYLQGKHQEVIPFYKVSDMNNNGNEVLMLNSNNYISKKDLVKLRTTIVPRSSIVFAKIGAALFLERKRILLVDSLIDNNMMAIIADIDNIDVKYLYYLLMNTKLSKYANTTALPSINRNDIGEIKFKIPSLHEQEAITQVLTNMDSEIEKLESKVDKYKQIKQGMMQNLLTGRIRLV